MKPTRIPITLLTGFLGVGKSTLLNKILKHPNAGKIAIIVNEFGEVGLDHDLIETTSEEVVLLPSGCICCTIRSDLAPTITALLDKRSVGKLDFDRIVIESTGLADPVPIQQTLLIDNFLASQTYLDGVVTIADTINGPKTLDDHFEAVSQAATADFILLSKTDLASAEQIEAFRTRLRHLNATAKIEDVDQAAKTPEILWGRSGFRQDVAEKDALAWVTKSPEPKAAQDPFANLSGLGAKPIAQPFVHDSGIVSASIEVDTPLKDQVFDSWLDTLIRLRGKDVLRVKAIIFLEGIEHPFAVHGVQHIFNPPFPLENWTKGDTTSRIVVIARNMTEAELQRSFDMLRAEPTATRTEPIFDEMRGNN
ncbi:MAG: GTP-binding protein [Pseudomonadota bacterium]